MVKCTDCGFLCERAPGTGVVSPLSRPAGTQPEYLEIPIEARRQARTAHGGWFECFAAEHDLGNEQTDEGLTAQEVVLRSRECSQFMDYVLGHTPKEHVMLRYQERLLEREDVRLKDQQVWQRGERRFDRVTRIIELTLIAGAAIAAAIAIVVSVLNDPEIHVNLSDSLTPDTPTLPSADKP